MLSLSCCVGQTSAATTVDKEAVKPNVEAPDKAVKPKKKGAGILGLLAKTIVGKKGGDKHFYAPFKKIPFTPKDHGLAYEEVNFKSADGTKLHAWFLPAKEGFKKAKSTVVFSHGNAGNVAYHLAFVDWMMENGYNVFLYDYRGYGKSEGKASKEGTIADALAAFRYVGERKDIDTSKLISVAHSLGGAKSLAAISQMTPEEKKRLRGIVVMGAFSSYKKIAESMMGKAAAHVVSDSHNPADLITKAPKVPLLVIHAKNDNIIPFSHGEELYEAANKPKSFFISENGGHNGILDANNKEMQGQLLAWLDNLMEK